MYKIYTDGSTLGNGKEENYGGWAYIIYNTDNDEVVGIGCDSESNTTNNKMELTAIVKALTSLPIQTIINDIAIEVYTDSAYIHNCYKAKWYQKWQKNGWINSKKEPVKNKELWEQIIPFFEDKKFEFKKTKAHADCDENNYVDKLAVNAATKLKNQGR